MIYTKLKIIKIINADIKFIKIDKINNKILLKNLITKF
jgi:hypothetical protein